MAHDANGRLTQEEAALLEQIHELANQPSLKELRGKSDPESRVELFSRLFTQGIAIAFGNKPKKKEQAKEEEKKPDDATR